MIKKLSEENPIMCAPKDASLDAPAPVIQEVSYPDTIACRVRWWLRDLKATTAFKWRALCEWAKWIGYTPSPLETHARRELEIAGWFDASDGDNFGRMMAEDTLYLIRAFCEAGHSGMSAGPALGLFQALAMYKPLTPLTGEDREWMECHVQSDGSVVYQNKRAGHVFKTVTPTETYVEDIDGKVFREPSGTCYTSSDSRTRVTFPYMPTTEYVDVPAYQDRAPGMNLNDPPVIGLCGFKGVGKSTAADFLVNHYGYVRVRFAQPLKDMCAALGLSHAQIDGDLKEVPDPVFGDKTPRHIMQTLGTEWGRVHVVEDLWARLLKRRVDNLLARGFKVVVDDVRFHNEADLILGFQDAVLWRVCDGMVSVASAGHVSERHVLDLPVSRVLDNYGHGDTMFRSIDGFFGGDRGGETHYGNR